ncbi:MAG: hypothetical protein V3U56_07635, partial [Syntrophobacteria bacterium]
PATIPISEMILVLLKNLIVINFFVVIDCFPRYAEPLLSEHFIQFSEYFVTQVSHPSGFPPARE